MSTNTTFNESDHPREGDGKFAAKDAPESEANLDDDYEEETFHEQVFDAVGPTPGRARSDIREAVLGDADDGADWDELIDSKAVIDDPDDLPLLKTAAVLNAMSEHYEGDVTDLLRQYATDYAKDGDDGAGDYWAVQDAFPDASEDDVRSWKPDGAPFFTHDNTTNYDYSRLSNDLDLYLVNDKAGATGRMWMIASVHRGGDVRTNYSEPLAFSFDNEDDLLNEGLDLVDGRGSVTCPRCGKVSWFYPGDGAPECDGCENTEGLISDGMWAYDAATSDQRA